MGSRVRTVFFSLLLLLIVGFVCEALASFYYFNVTTGRYSALLAMSQKAMQGVLRRAAPLKIYTDHETRGYCHIADTVGKHIALDFSVEYRLGPNGERSIPRPDKSKGRIVFLGGSYTFGHGVENDESFAALLSRNEWKDWEIVNRAVSGYGTAHGYLMLEEELQRETPPAAVIYPFLNGHTMRNYLNYEWMRTLHIFGRNHPHFEIEDGKVVYQGLAGLEDAKPNNAETRVMEIDLTIRMLQEMDRMCQEKGVEFFLVLLPGTQWPPKLAHGMYSLTHPPLDVSQFQLEAFANDGHPNASDHRYLAERIAESHIGAWVRERALAE